MISVKPELVLFTKITLILLLQKQKKSQKYHFFSYLLFLLEIPYNNVGQSQENILISPSLVISTKEQLQVSFNTILMKPELMLWLD